MLAKNRKRIISILMTVLLLFTMMPLSMHAEEVRADGDTSHLIVGVENIIMTGLNSRGQIIAGREVTFACAYMMNLNADLRQVLESGGDVTFGIRRSSGDPIVLTPEGGVCTFVAPESDGFVSYWFTVTVDATGEVYESNTAFTVNADQIRRLTLLTEGQGTAEASSYEVRGVEEIRLTLTPAEGWFFYKLEDVSGDWWIPAGKQDTISLGDPEVTIKAVFKEIGTAGYCGDDAEWTLDIDTGVLTITGTGAINDGAFCNYNINRIHDWDAVTSVVIGEGITAIGEKAFYYCDQIQSVSLPEGITSIGKSAFGNCKKLSQINLPQSLKTIAQDGFYTCEKLSQIELPEGLETLGDHAFAYSGLTEITVPQSVSNMESHMFYECRSLTSAVIKAPITELKDCTFYRCDRLISVTLPDTLESLGDDSFSLCHSLRSLDLPAGITSFGEGVFYQNRGIRSITIPAGVKEIPRYTFWKCTYLESVELPAGLESVGMCAFMYCSQLTSVELPERVTSLGSDAFSYCSLLRQINIPSGITEIPMQCFTNCVSLPSIVVPENIGVIGEKAFGSCSSLSQITLPSGITKIPAYCFENCEKLQTIDIPAGVTEIGYGAFMGAGITGITLPGGLKKLGMYAFRSPKLQGTVTIPAGVTQIDEYAFYLAMMTKIVNLSEVEIPVSDIIKYGAADDGFLDSSGAEVATIGQGTYTRKPSAVKKTIVASGVTGIAAGYPYTGSAIKPVPTVKVDGAELNSGTDFTLTYKNNKEIGVATVTVTGKGNYEGTVSKTFRVQFTDVIKTGEFYYDPVYWAVDKGITNGWADGSFRPWNTCNRAAVVTFLWRMAGKPSPRKIATFKDMPKNTAANQDFRMAISWASEKGITSGYSGNLFKPWDECNRAAIITFIWRYAGKPSSDLAVFSDLPKNTAANQDFRKAISWGYLNGIVTGYAGNKYKPWDKCNRAAVVTFLYRYYSKQ